MANGAHATKDIAPYPCMVHGDGHIHSSRNGISSLDFVMSIPLLWTAIARDGRSYLGYDGPDMRVFACAGFFVAPPIAGDLRHVAPAGRSRLAAMIAAARPVEMAPRCFR
jgi:hypothetical protein